MNNLLGKLLKHSTTSLQEENTFLRERVRELEEINLEISTEKTLLYFDEYREVNSLADRIKNIRSNKTKTEQDRVLLDSLINKYYRLSDKLKSNNIMQNLLRSEYLVGFMYNLLRDKGLTDELHAFKMERKKIHSQKWVSLDKI